jgi:hypothetical protein
MRRSGPSRRSSFFRLSKRRRPTDCAFVVGYAACRRGSPFLFDRVRGGRGAVSPSGTHSLARSWCAENGIGGIACRQAAHWQRDWCMLGGSFRSSRISRAASRRERPLRAARPSASMNLAGKDALKLSIADDAVLSDAPVRVQPQHQPLGVDTDEPALRSEPVHQIPVSEVASRWRLAKQLDHHGP